VEDNKKAKSDESVSKESEAEEAKEEARKAKEEAEKAKEELERAKEKAEVEKKEREEAKEEAEEAKRELEKAKEELNEQKKEREKDDVEGSSDTTSSADEEEEEGKRKAREKKGVKSSSASSNDKGDIDSENDGGGAKSFIEEAISYESDSEESEAKQWKGRRKEKKKKEDDESSEGGETSDDESSDEDNLGDQQQLFVALTEAEALKAAKEARVAGMIMVAELTRKEIDELPLSSTTKDQAKALANAWEMEKKEELTALDEEMDEIVEWWAEMVDPGMVLWLKIKLMDDGEKREKIQAWTKGKDMASLDTEAEKVLLMNWPMSLPCQRDSALAEIARLEKLPDALVQQAKLTVQKLSVAAVEKVKKKMMSNASTNVKMGPEGSAAVRALVNLQRPIVEAEEMTKISNMWLDINRKLADE
jgi:hypothetical protein